MNSVDINFSEFGPPIKLIIIDPKKYKSRFKTNKAPSQLNNGRPAAPQPTRQQQQQQYSAFEYPNNQRQLQQQSHKVPTSSSTPNPIPVQQQHNSNSTDNQSSTARAIDTPAAASINTKDDKQDRIEEDIIEEEDEQLQSFLTTEQTTRAGRVSKKTKLFSANAVSSKTNGASTMSTDSTANGEGSAPPKPKVKKRKPAEAFRCKTCSKYYVGHTKLRLHYKKNPDHKIPPPPKPAAAAVPANSNLEPSTKNPTPVPESPSDSPDIVILKACTSIGVQANLHHQSSSNVDPTLSLLTGNQPLPVNANDTLTHPLTLEIDSDGAGDVCGGRRGRALLDPITVPMTSGNAMSPGENSMNAAMTTLAMTMPNGPMEHALEFRCTDKDQVQNIEVNSVDKRAPENSCTGSGSSDAFASSGVGTESQSQIQTEPAKNTAGKPIWEFVEEKLICEGINQILTEISDVAEKLSKIARDKIIPIREEEEERLASSVPIIQVDNPFLSHLLDLPFGTYIFKEDDDDDSPRRVKPPPPSITELSQFSLTGGAEVDIDKFLTPESSAATSLPHLTNLDFNAICNNNNNDDDGAAHAGEKR